MKKLKAHEITEPGPYWRYFKGVLESAPLILIFRKKEHQRLYVKYFGQPDSDWFNGNLSDDYEFIKAEPQKVCRWTSEPTANGCKVNVARRGCDKDAKPTTPLWPFCPYCGGHIEIEGE